MNEKKIQEAIRKGDLIPFKKIWDTLSVAEQQRIDQRAKFLILSMEIRKLRRNLKLSQQQLAEKMGVKREFVTLMETGRQNLTIETLYKLAEATNKKLEFNFV